MGFIKGKYWAITCSFFMLVYNLIAPLNAQSELFSPSKILNLKSFEISNNNSIFVLDQENNLYFSKGKSFNQLSNKQFSQLISSANLFVINKDSCFQILDSVHLPQIIGTPFRGKDLKTVVYNNKFYHTIGDSILIDEESKIIKLPIGTKDVTCSGVDLYAAGDHGLWIYEQNNWKKYQIPSLPQNANYKRCTSRNGKLALCDQSKIYFFDSQTYDFDEYYVNGLIDDLEFDSDGNIWYLSKGNLYYFQRSKITTDNISIANVIIDGSPNALSTKYQLKGGNNTFEILLDHHNLIPSEEITQYYFLENFDSKWLPYKEDRIKYILPIGKYTFKVKTTANTITTYGQEFDIEVVAEENQSFLYLIGAIASILLILSVLQYFRYQRQLEQMQSKIKLLQTQASLTRTQTKLNQISINPHFLFNSLNNIQGLLLEDDKSLARKQLRNFSLLMRQVLDTNEQEYIRIEEDIKFLKQYLELEKMNHNNCFEYQIVMDQKIDLAALIPPMLTQIPVENAVVHGMKGKTSEGKITIQYTLKESNIIEVTVEDNGNGIVSNKTHHNSKGTTLLQERLKNVPNAYALENITKDGEQVGCRSILKIRTKHKVS